MLKIRFLISIIVIFQLTYSQLIYVAEVFRHGARYPISDVYDGKQSIKYRGQINSIGMRQQYLLGTYIYHQYIQQMGFIPTKFNPNTIEVLSSSQPMSLSSAYSQLLGLFPLGWEIPAQVSSDKLLPPFISQSTDNLKKQLSQYALDMKFQPVPVYTIDEILSNCSNFGIFITQKYKEVVKTVTQFQALHSGLINKLRIVLNLTIFQTTVHTMAALYDTLQSDFTIGKDVPKDISEADMKQLKYIHDYYRTLIYNGNVSQLATTPLLSLIQSNLNNAAFGSNKKLSLYSVQQQNILSMMTFLNLTSYDCIQQRWKNQTISSLNCMQPPAFSANLIFQLHRDDAFENVVKIRYNGQYVYLCQKKQTTCKLQEFKRRIQNNFVDYKKLCG